MRTFFVLLLTLAPVITNAATPTDFKGLVSEFLKIINLIIPFLFGLSLVVFIWGIVGAWILGGGDETKVESGKSIAVAGIIGLVVMSAVWGIVALIRSSIF